MSDLREALNAAFDREEGGGGDPGATDAGGSVHTDVPAPDNVGASAVEATTPDEGGSDKGTAEAAQTAARARDATGKFAKADAKAPTQKKAVTITRPPGGAGQQGAQHQVNPGATGAPTDGAEPPAPVATKAPQSWSPVAREAFAKAPPEVQKEVLKREQEIARGLQEAAPARRFHQELAPVFQRAQSLMAARGLGPGQLVAQYVQADTQLSHPDPAIKAQAAAQLLRSYGVDIDHLARALDGATGNPQSARQMDPQAIAQQATQTVMQNLQAYRQQAMSTRATAEVNAFAEDSGNEFFSDVWPDMAAIVDGARTRGVEMSLKDAYDRAVWANPELRVIVEQRKAAEQAKANQASTQRAVRASSSVKSSPAVANGATKADSLRGAIEAAWVGASGR